MLSTSNSGIEEAGNAFQTTIRKKGIVVPICPTDMLSRTKASHSMYNLYIPFPLYTEAKTAQ